MKRSNVWAYALSSILLWLVSLYLTWTVSPRLALAFACGSVAFNLSEWVREQKRTATPKRATGLSDTDRIVLAIGDLQTTVKRSARMMA